MCKISVIVPVYNAEEFLSETLSSIQSQSIQDIEIVCVDDGSKDNSAKIIKEKQKRDCRIRYEYQLNQGAGGARNRGIEISKGEFIAFMDADDSYPNVYTLENLYTAAIENKALVCGGSAQSVDTKLDSDGKRVFSQMVIYGLRIINLIFYLHGLFLNVALLILTILSSLI